MLELRSDLLKDIPFLELMICSARDLIHYLDQVIIKEQL